MGVLSRLNLIGGLCVPAAQKLGAGFSWLCFLGEINDIEHLLCLGLYSADSVSSPWTLQPSDGTGAWALTEWRR